MNKVVKLYVNGNVRMNYAVYSPDTFKDLPLLIYLHGAGERGNNIEHLSRHAIPKLLSEGVEYPAVILTPQCPADRVWDNVVDDVKNIIDSVVDEYGISSDRICITGSSMGGFGTWMMGLTFSNFFSVIAPIAGGAMSWRMSNLKNTPVIVYHGEKDSVVPPIYSQFCVDAVNRSGGVAKLTLLKDMEHNDGINYAYAETELIKQILEYRRTDFGCVPEMYSNLF